MNLDELLERSHQKLGRTRRHHFRSGLFDSDKDIADVEVNLNDFYSVRLNDFWSVFSPRPRLTQLTICFYAKSEQTFYLHFVRDDGSITCEIGVSNAIPYPLQDVQAIIEASVTSVSATTKDAHIADGDMWVVYLLLHDTSIGIDAMADVANRLAANLGISEKRQSFDHFGQIVYKVRSGLHEQLLGEAERSWLEFKSSTDLDSEKGKIDLAQAVARFANSERAGLLIIGFRTQRKDGADIVIKMSPVAKSERNWSARRVMISLCRASRVGPRRA